MKDTKISNILYASRTGDIEAVSSFLKRGIIVVLKASNERAFFNKL